MMKLYGLVVLCLMTLALTGCGDRVIAIEFEREPPTDSAVLSDLKKVLSTQGITVTASTWEASNTLRLHADSDLDYTVFKENVAKALQPLRQASISSSPMSLSVDDSDQNKIEYIELEQGQRFSLQPNWRKADFGNYIMSHNVDSLSAVSDVTKQCICGVKIPLQGKIPAFLMAQIPIKTDTLKEMSSRSPTLLSMYLKASRNLYTIRVKLEIEEIDKDKPPWENVMFLESDPAKKSLINGDDDVYYIESNGNQYCYLIFAENRINELNVASNTSYNSASSMPHGCLYTHEECGQLIRDKIGGDLFGITAYNALGNVKSYKVF
ncbi:MAG: hypothetical protein KZQ93_05215 [Candidatus Thiodiazotropha sp. (ex Monitilora ramsayi)]|nr:hypothetical protein [Candidatus Thiodiazotropha sp. (ex Monitilora ramsayi)]